MALPFESVSFGEISFVYVVPENSNSDTEPITEPIPSVTINHRPIIINADYRGSHSMSPALQDLELQPEVNFTSSQVISTGSFTSSQILSAVGMYLAEVNRIGACGFFNCR
jgi:hypothetical protein